MPGPFSLTGSKIPEHARLQVKGGHSSGEIELLLSNYYLTIIRRRRGDYL
jgi:hypothetical protein